MHITGWHLQPSLELVRDRDPPVVLGRLVAERAEMIDVRVLLWAGAPMPLFQPIRAAVRAVRECLNAGDRSPKTRSNAVCPSHGASQMLKEPR